VAVLGSKRGLKRTFLILCISYMCLVALPAESRWRFLPKKSLFPSTTFQFGRILGQVDTKRRARIGMEVFHGRAQIAVFNYTEDLEPTAWDQLPIEQYVAVSIWYDF